jgi:hypothetical protein
MGGESGNDQRVLHHSKRGRRLPHPARCENAYPRVTRVTACEKIDDLAGNVVSALEDVWRLRYPIGGWKWLATWGLCLDNSSFSISNLRKYERTLPDLIVIVTIVVGVDIVIPTNNLKI